MNKQQQLEAKLKALQEECAEHGFELLGAILDSDEALVTTELMKSDQLFNDASDTLAYALEEFDTDFDGAEFEVVYFAVKSE